MNTPATSIETPLTGQRVAAGAKVGVGLVGTGYAAKLRAETLAKDPRSVLVAVAGHSPEKTQAFSQTHNTQAAVSWRRLIEDEDIDLVIISNISRDHGLVARAALNAGKHVVVEYPLSLDPAEAQDLIDQATRTGLLLHVEHIELLGGVHQALVKSLSEVGSVFYARYCTISPARPAPRRWSYHQDLFGFPLTSALSRIHRLTDLFGQVASVSCQTRFWNPPSPTTDPGFFTACLSCAQLRFRSGIVAEVVYGKGEAFWHTERKLEVWGDRGTLIFDGDEGRLLRSDQVVPLEVGARRGAFAKDTTMVLDHLLEGTPLYVSPQASLHSLKVADAARLSAQTGLVVDVE